MLDLIKIMKQIRRNNKIKRNNSYKINQRKLAQHKKMMEILIEQTVPHVCKEHSLMITDTLLTASRDDQNFGKINVRDMLHVFTTGVYIEAVFKHLQTEGQVLHGLECRLEGDNIRVIIPSGDEDIQPNNTQDNDGDTQTDKNKSDNKDTQINNTQDNDGNIQSDNTQTNKNKSDDEDTIYNL